MLNERLQAVHIQAALVVPTVDRIPCAAVKVVGDFVIVDHGEGWHRGGKIAPRIDAVTRCIVLNMLGAELIQRLRGAVWHSWACHVCVDGVAEFHKELQVALVSVQDRVEDPNIAAPVTRNTKAHAR